MSQNHPPPRSPDASSDRDMITNNLNNAFDAMFLHPPIVSPDDFNDNWGAVVTEQALALSHVDDARLKDCIVAASASVWGVQCGIILIFIPLLTLSADVMHKFEDANTTWGNVCVVTLMSSTIPIVRRSTDYYGAA
jgi:hypothetical protein